jgi:hypothetical protein
VHTQVDSASCLSSAVVGSSSAEGFVRNSVLSNVRCNYIEAEGCVLVNVTADRIIAKPGSIIYNFVQTDDAAAETAAGDVIAGVFSEDGAQLVMRSNMATDGGNVAFFLPDPLCLFVSFFPVSFCFNSQKYSMLLFLAVILVVCCSLNF